jgi:hypothetical protein
MTKLAQSVLFALYALFCFVLADTNYVQHYTSSRYAFPGVQISDVFPTLSFTDITQMLSYNQQELILLTSNSLLIFTEIDPTKSPLVKRVDTQMNITIVPGTRMAWLHKNTTLVLAIPNVGVSICVAPFNKACVTHQVTLGVVSAVEASSQGTIFVGSTKGLYSMSVKGRNFHAPRIVDPVTSLGWNDQLQLLTVGTAAKFYTIDERNRVERFQWTNAVVELGPTAQVFIDKHDGKNTSILYLGNPICINTYDTTTKVYGRMGGIIDMFNDIEGVGIPYGHITTMTKQGSDLWIGTIKGAARFDTVAQTWSYYHSVRWMIGSNVTSIVTVPSSNANIYHAWISTEQGLSKVTIDGTWTLERKAEHFHKLDLQHDRDGIISLDCTLQRVGDLKNCKTGSQDSDGLWTSYHLGGLCYKYAVTKDPKVKQEALRAFSALEKLNFITGIPGLPARSFASWEDAKHAGGTWYNSTVYPGLAWKGDTSSDTISGHLYVYPVFYDLVAETPEEKQRALYLIESITWYIVSNDYYLIDVTGLPTTWGVWNPIDLESEKHKDERGLNALQIVAWLASAYRVTKDEKYLGAVRYLKSQGYFENIVNTKLIDDSDINTTGMVFVQTNDIGGSDDQLAALSYMVYYHNVKQLDNPEEFGKSKIDLSIQRWIKLIAPWQSSLFNVVYMASSANRDSRLIQDTIKTFKQWPLDTITWCMMNSHRLDIIKSPQDTRIITRVLPYDEREYFNWNSSPFRIDSPGICGTSAKASFAFTMPYWAASYYKIVE